MAFIPRLYIGSDKIENGRAFIDGSDANHVLRVLRKQKGDNLYICDMHGNAYNAIIESIGDDNLVALLGEPEKKDVEMPFKVSVYQCFPKGDKLETVIQKAVELGVTRIVPFESSRCIKRPKADKVIKQGERLSKIAEEAAKQR